MPDITKCSDTSCPLRYTCYRYISNPNDIWQAYFTESPYNEDDDTCDYYWEIKIKDDEKIL
jgi:hypothetical protein